jgi:hypothetical protein
MSKGVCARIGLLTESLDLVQLFPPQFVDFIVECQRIPYVLVANG